MIRRAFLALIIACVAFAACGAEQIRSALWPPIEPFKTEMLKVSDLHSIYYELSGNPRGKPVFVLHGGPGAMASPALRRFFNPKKYLIVLHDQRGCGRSQPFGEIRENDTWALVGDIERLRAHLKLGKIILFGGSWGSTLALAYGETHPENVEAMVLRGIFTSTKEELDHYYAGGTAKFFPEAYDRLRRVLPDSTAPLTPRALYELTATEPPDGPGNCSREWLCYEAEIAEIETDLEETERWYAESKLGKRLAYSLSLFENYYMANRCFFEEGQLFKDAGRLKDIPVLLVNGRYDMICPPITAYRLHRILPKSRLVIAERSGHSVQEPAIEEALVKAMRDLE